MEHFVDIVTSYGSDIKSAEQQQCAGNVELGQHVLARSFVHGGTWCNAFVLSTGQG